MANSVNPLPPFPPPQPGDVNVQLPNPNETTLKGFKYQVAQNLGPPSALVTLTATKYFEYAVAKTIFDWSGLCCSPVMGTPGTPASVTRRCSPYGRMVLHWYSTRHGGNPLIPSRDLGDVNCVYEKGWVGMNAPGYLADGTKAITIEGVYEYFLRVPYEETDSLISATNPYINVLAAENLLSPADYSKLIAGPNLPPAAAGSLSGINF